MSAINYSNFCAPDPVAIHCSERVAADPLDLFDAYVSPSKQTSDTKPRSSCRSVAEALRIIDLDALCRVASTFYDDNSRVNWILHNTAPGASHILFDLRFDGDTFWVAVRLSLPDKFQPTRGKYRVLEREVPSLMESVDYD